MESHQPPGHDPWHHRRSLRSLWRDLPLQPRPVNIDFVMALRRDDLAEEAQERRYEQTAADDLPRGREGCRLDRRKLAQLPAGDLPRVYDDVRLRTLYQCWEVFQLYKAYVLGQDMKKIDDRENGSTLRRHAEGCFDDVVDGLRGLISGAALEDMTAPPRGIEEAAALIGMTRAEDPALRIRQEVVCLLCLSFPASAHPVVTRIEHDLVSVLQVCDQKSTEDAIALLDKMRKDRAPPPRLHPRFNPNPGDRAPGGL